MKDSTVLILVIGGIALIVWAFSRGILTSTGLGINPATGQAYGSINVPQPSTNYSGYLAASTAPGVSGALNQAITGIGNLFSGWINSANPAPPVNQGPNPNSPALAAQPQGPSTSFYTGASAPAQLNAPQYAANVGPAVPPEISYNNTSGAAFDFTGLAAANGPDSSYSLEQGLMSS